MLTLHPCTFAVDVTTCSTRSRNDNSVSVDRARIVPLILVEAGIILKASPALIMVILHTPLSSGLSVRDTSVCRFITIDDAVTIGSIVKWGMAACPPTPSITISNRSHAANSGPGLDAMEPEGRL
jgi:hypothetical protein